MSELAVTVLQFGLLLLLWILILSIIGAQGRDMTISKRSRARAAAPHAAPAPRSGPPAPSGANHSGPTPRPRPRRLLVSEGPLAGTEIPLGSASIMMGRAQECTLVLDDDYASGKHARLFPQGSRWFLEDLGSTNGTWLGEDQLTRASTVEPGDRIRIGKTVLELRT
ncbi:signal peptide protein [Nesterenkonia sp. AN1]|uniref:Type III secretion system (T3SS) inner membrane Yop/YscD-like protein n=1 Tax=Nesterenkonia aurantiaca TaxID=1436010 RepID=A0A4R7G693_9MICC|nr:MULTISPECIES: FHA domain-containing protein [Nesterenkonia]EXF24802.1 signal peptide protein [Nesterenkonia sp. AN1]MBO0595164.1 FHA domain-containing protein [Nesterenkonia sp. E16_10]MBO0598990.1 FHA domain-containing protein [Nesterenkonia sp. E16_7]TDS86720.1 type III secretion system (T3SS) inner membrane Yop/YscD-like protein [Nesterenkonia aurantiaca]